MIQVFIPAPDLPPVRKRATGKLAKPNGWLNSNQRRHRIEAAKLTKLWREEAAEAFAGLPRMGKVHIRADVWRSRGGRYDVLNLWPSLKACIDGAVDSGLIEDDSHEYLTGPDMRHGGVTKSGPGLLLTVTEIFEENTQQTVHSCPLCGTIEVIDTKAAPQ